MIIVGGVVLALLVFFLVEGPVGRAIADHPKKEWIKPLILVPILIAIGIGMGMFALLITGETQSTTLWKDSIPGNLQLDSPDDAPSYTLEAQLEKSDQPVFLKLDTWGSHYVNVELELFDPNGNRLLYIPPKTRIACTNSGCDPLIYKLDIVQSGTYSIKARSLSAYAKEITISFFQSDWLAEHW